MRKAIALLMMGAVIAMGCAAPAAAPAPTTAPAKPAAAPTAAAPSQSAPAAAPTAAKPAAWQPQKPIEFVVQSSAGGGSDLFVRALSDVLVKQKLVSQPIVVLNKSGAAGAIAFNYVGEKKGDAHTLMNLVSTLITTPLTQAESKYTYKDYTFLGVLGLDEYLLLVKGDSPIKSVSELVEKAKADPKGMKAGGGYLGSSDSICSALLERAAKVQFTFVPFNAGSDAVAALLGGHVDMVWANPGEAMELVEAKKAKILAVASDKRMQSLPDVPTFKETGLDVIYQQFRGVAAPGGIPKEAASYYEGALKKVSDDPAWRDGFIKNNKITPTFMDSAAASKYIEEQNQMYVTILKELGVIK